MLTQERLKELRRFEDAEAAHIAGIGQLFPKQPRDEKERA
jgi:hypothetical protein